MKVNFSSTLALILWQCVSSTQFLRKWHALVHQFYSQKNAACRNRCSFTQKSFCFLFFYPHFLEMNSYMLCYQSQHTQSHTLTGYILARPSGFAWLSRWECTFAALPGAELRHTWALSRIAPAPHHCNSARGEGSRVYSNVLQGKVHSTNYQLYSTGKKCVH